MMNIAKLINYKKEFDALSKVRFDAIYENRSNINYKNEKLSTAFKSYKRTFVELSKEQKKLEELYKKQIDNLTKVIRLEKHQIKVFTKGIQYMKHLVIDNHGDIYLPFVNDEGIVFICKFKLIEINNNIFSDSFIYEITLDTFRNMKDLTFTTIKFTKEFKDIQQYINGKSIKFVSIIAPQLFLKNINS